MKPIVTYTIAALVYCAMAFEIASAQSTTDQGGTSSEVPSCASWYNTKYGQRKRDAIEEEGTQASYGECEENEKVLLTYGVTADVIEALARNASHHYCSRFLHETYGHVPGYIKIEGPQASNEACLAFIKVETDRGIDFYDVNFVTIIFFGAIGAFDTHERGTSGEFDYPYNPCADWYNRHMAVEGGPYEPVTTFQFSDESCFKQANEMRLIPRFAAWTIEALKSSVGYGPAYSPCNQWYNEKYGHSTPYRMDVRGPQITDRRCATREVGLLDWYFDVFAHTDKIRILLFKTSFDALPCSYFLNTKYGNTLGFKRYFAVHQYPYETCQDAEENFLSRFEIQEETWHYILVHLDEADYLTDEGMDHAQCGSFGFVKETEAYALCRQQLYTQRE